jgi:predicted Zn-dependent peptidase
MRGAAHFIEHMCFKGTTHISNVRKLYLNYDEIGAYINASTDKRFTKYVVRCNTEYLANMLEILSDMILNSTFEKNSFKREERVVIEENVMRDKDPSEQLYNGIDSMLYNGTNYAKPIDSVDYHKKLFERDEIVKFYKAFYTPNRVILSIVSPMSFDAIKRIINHTYFASVTKPNHTFPQLNSCPTPNTEIQYKIIKSVGTYVSVSFRFLTEDRHIMSCLGAILSGPMSSRLWKILRDDAALVYGANADTTVYETYSDFCIYCDTDNSKILTKPGVLPLTIDLVNDLIQNGVNATELNVAKGYLNGQMTRQSENDIHISEYNGIEAIMFPIKSIVPYSKLFDKFYKQITVEDINQCIRKYFRKEFMCVCITCDKPVKLASVKTISERLVG